MALSEDTNASFSIIYEVVPEAIVPKHFQIFATVSFSLPAGVALTAIEVGFNGATIPRFNIFHPFAHLQNFNPEFMSGYTRIVKKGKLTQIATHIRSTNTHPNSANQSFPRTGAGRFFHLALFKSLGCS